MNLNAAQSVQRGWSISALAKELGLDRRTVSARLEKVKPCGTNGGYPVYALRDAAVALLSDLGAPAMAGDFDPDNLAPKERKDWWDSENSRLRAERDSGHLCEAHAVEREMHALIAPIAAMLETLPDVLERDASLTPEQAEILQRVIDAERVRCAELIEAAS